MTANAARDSQAQSLGSDGPRHKALNLDGFLDLLPRSVVIYDISPTCWIFACRVVYDDQEFRSSVHSLGFDKQEIPGA